MKLSRPLVMLGMMGAGKSTVAGLISNEADCSLHSLDQAIEEQAGKDIPAIFAREGEAAFRDYESEALKQILYMTYFSYDKAEFRDYESKALTQASQPKPCVIDTGGGIIESQANRDLLAGSETDRCYLAVPLETLLERIGDGHGRPMLAGTDIKARTEQLLQDRDQHYRDVATIVIEPDAGADAATVAKQVAREIGS